MKLYTQETAPRSVGEASCLAYRLALGVDEQVACRLLCKRTSGDTTERACVDPAGSDLASARSGFEHE